MSIRIIPKAQQGSGAFNGGEIVENKPIGFPQDHSSIRPYSNLFYWAHARAVTGRADDLDAAADGRLDLDAVLRRDRARGVDRLLDRAQHGFDGAAAALASGRALRRLVLPKAAAGGGQD